MNHASSFGGLWIDEAGSPHIAIAGHKQGILDAIEASRIDPTPIIEYVQFSEATLNVTMAEVVAAVEKEGDLNVDDVDVTSIVLSIPDNAIVFNHSEGADAKVERLRSRFGAAATFSDSATEFLAVACTGRTNCGSPVRAGIQLYRNNSTPTGRSTACMSAFVIKDLVLPPRYSILSAGHCYNATYTSRYHPTSTYLGSTAGIPPVYTFGSDAMRIPIPASQASNLLYISSASSRSVTSSQTSGEVIGSQVCSSKLSGNDCGSLLSTNVCSDNGAICGLRLASNQFACGGDSGSPVYKPVGSTAAQALGIMQGKSTGTTPCPDGTTSGNQSVYTQIANGVASLGRFVVVTSAP